MRIAHFVQRYPPALGGSEAYFAHLSRALVEAGHQVTVFTTNALDLTAFWSRSGKCLPAGRSVEDGVEVRRYPLWRLPAQRYLLKALSLLPHRGWQAATLSCNPLPFGMWSDAGQAEEHFDLVHATAFPYAFPLLCARRLARRLGAPFVLTPFIHFGDPDNPQDPTRRAYTQPALVEIARSARRLFVQTEGEFRLLREHRFSADSLVLQGMGIRVEDCTGGDRNGTRATWGVGTEEMVVGHLANNSREKGTVDLLHAAEQAWDQGGHFRLVLAGPEMPNFLSSWRGYRSASRVRRLGILDDQQKRDFFAALDVFALPSRVDSFGIVLLEAWANGCANIAYRAGGPACVIRQERDGLLVACGDVNGLAGALLRLAGDVALRDRLGQAGKERLKKEFRWEDKLAMVLRVYHEVTGRAISREPVASAEAPRSPEARG
jgi:glycosyltransferase involved in cell wall biosynthesis